MRLSQLDKTPLIMGILNVTPDSFSDGGKHNTLTAAIDHALQMIEDGADMIDIGGESSRPGALPISFHEEEKRILPVIQEIRKLSQIYISIDTYKPEVMAKTIDLGVNMINDIKALQEMGSLDVIANSSVDVCLMHMQGTPEMMQINPVYDSVVSEVEQFLTSRVSACEKKGINRNRILLDPGFGFGKTQLDNILLYKSMNQFLKLNLPLLIGVSKKSMVKNIVGENKDDIIHTSAFLAALAAKNGAQVLRVHNIKETKKMLNYLEII